MHTSNTFSNQKLLFLCELHFYAGPYNMNTNVWKNSSPESTSALLSYSFFLPPSHCLSERNFYIFRCFSLGFFSGIFSGKNTFIAQTIQCAHHICEHSNRNTFQFAHRILVLLVNFDTNAMIKRQVNVTTHL